MYVKPSHRQIRGVYVPDNYNGTTFTEPEIQADIPEPTESATGEPPQQEQKAAAPMAVSAKAQEGGLMGGLFSGFGGLRSDDLLLLALIMLMSRSDGEQGEHRTAEILPLLALLLFMG